MDGELKFIDYDHVDSMMDKLAADSQRREKFGFIPDSKSDPKGDNTLYIVRIKELEEQVETQEKLIYDIRNELSEQAYSLKNRRIEADDDRALITQLKEKQRAMRYKADLVTEDERATRILLRSIMQSLIGHLIGSVQDPLMLKSWGGSYREEYNLCRRYHQLFPDDKLSV